MGEPAKGVSSCHGLQGLAERFLQRFMGPGSYSTQERFDLGEGFLNGRVIRRIGWQKEQFTASSLDEFTDATSFMHTQIV